MKKRSLLRYKIPFLLAAFAVTSPATHSAPSFLRGSLGTLLTGLTCLVMQGRQSNASYEYFVNRSSVLSSGRSGNDMIATSDGNLLVAQRYESNKVGFQKFNTDGTSLWLVNVIGTDLQSVLQTSEGGYIGVGTVEREFTYQTGAICGFELCTETITSEAVSIIFLTPPNTSGALNSAEITSYRAFGAVAGHQGKKLIKLRGGDYIVVGTNVSPSLQTIFSNEGEDIVLARITESGSKVWLNRYFVAPSVFAFGGAPSRDPTADKFFIVGQHDAAFFVGKVDADATTASTDVQFDFKRSVGIVNGAIFIGSLRAHDLVETVDQSRLIVVGAHSLCCEGGVLGFESYERLFIAELTDNGIMRRVKTLTYQGENTYDFSTTAWSVKQTSDDGFLITGEYRAYETDDTSVLLVEVDTSLNLVLVRVYEEGLKNGGRSCLLTSDGRRYATGYTTDLEAGTPTLTTPFIGQWTSSGDGCGRDITSSFALESQPWQVDSPSGGNPAISYFGNTPMGDAEEGLMYVSLDSFLYIGNRPFSLDPQKNVCIGNTDEPTRAPVPSPTRQPVSPSTQQLTPRPTKRPTKSAHPPHPFTLTALFLPMALTLQFLRG